ncbi:MAG: hypothetical protein JNK76_14920 [Planctomycetales bacterium]|nr:hypothetical protein [Planctomycetales bacterium]MBN8627303.1 hypothetical protein [Planctomycetota bacterium]
MQRFGKRPLSWTAAGVLLFTFVAIAQALPPARVRFHTIGADAKGVIWKVRLSVDEPMLVSGARDIPVKTKDPLDLFEIYAIIDLHDTAWIVDGEGRGVRVKLADGVVEEFRVPVTMQLLGGIVVRDGRLYFGDSGGATGQTVRQMDVASGETKTLLTLAAERTLYKLVPGKLRLWIASCSGLASSRHIIELAALDWAGGNVTLQSQREMPWANPSWNSLEVVEAEDGAAWVATGLSGRVERLDASGMWQGWSLDGLRPSKLVAARFGAACLLEQLQMTKGPHFPGAPIEVPTLLGREIAAFQPGSPKFMKCPVETDVNLSADHDGSVRVEGRGRLSLEGGRLQIVP